MINITKKFLLIILLLVIVLAGVVFWISEKKAKEKERQEFLSKLKGEIVFLRRDEEGVLNIWKINANGTGEKWLYKHNYGGEAANFNCSFPEWSKDGKKIYFRAMSEKGWAIYEMDPDGKNVRIAENPVDYSKKDGVSRVSRADDILVKEGSIYIYEEGVPKLIFKHKGPYDPAYNPGAEEVDWSPDKKYIIFVYNFGRIMIADREGNVVELTKGMDPDWKY